tara:strand:- start:285 stop:518 length:234 start_codon:yes stop_codon:yes gene_type:complete
MINEIITMSGYGLFVWSSFIITLVSCFYLYIKTLKTLRKYEKEFAKEIKKLPNEQRELVLKSSKIATQVLSSYNKTI